MVQDGSERLYGSGMVGKEGGSKQACSRKENSKYMEWLIIGNEVAFFED